MPAAGWTSAHRSVWPNSTVPLGVIIDSPQQPVSTVDIQAFAERRARLLGPWARRRRRPHRAGACAQPRLAPPLPLRQLLLLSDRLSRTGSRCRAGRRESRKQCSFAARRIERRRCGTVFVTARRPRGKLSASTKRTRLAARRETARPARRPARPVVLARSRRRLGRPRRRRAQCRARRAAPERAPAEIRDVRAELDDMRLIKDAHEIVDMRRAADISAAAHRRAMRATAPGRFEYEIEAELVHEFRRRGAQAPPIRRSSPAAPTPASCITSTTASRCGTAICC